MRRFSWIAGMTLLLLGQAPADMPGHAALKDATSCLACHREDGQARWTSHSARACTPFCLTCHGGAEMAQHHPIGTALAKETKAGLLLTHERKTACFTCHDLGRPRFDSVRWKAESLYGRLFRRESKFKTYFLTTRNDKGQLCLACH
jgi:hypothetical protein